MNLPVSTLRRVCDKVVAVNVSPIMAQDYKMNIVSIAMRSFHFMFRANTFPEREKCDLLIEPYNLYGYSNTELEKAEEIFMQGYNAANTLLDKFVGKCQVANGIVILMAIEIVSIITEGFTQSVTIIEHRCYTIEPEAVESVFLKPVLTIRKKKMDNFILSIVETK